MKLITSPYQLKFGTYIYWQGSETDQRIVQTRNNFYGSDGRFLTNYVYVWVTLPAMEDMIDNTQYTRQFANFGSPVDAKYYIMSKEEFLAVRLGLTNLGKLIDETSH